MTISIIALFSTHVGYCFMKMCWTETYAHLCDFVFLCDVQADFRIKMKFKIARTACLFFITSNVHSCSEQESSILIIYVHICARCDVKIISKCKCYNKQLMSAIVSIYWKKQPYCLIQYIYHCAHCTVCSIFDVKVQSKPHLRRRVC